jgi:hypothetical protein
MTRIESDAANGDMARALFEKVPSQPLFLTREAIGKALILRYLYPSP